MSVRGTWQTLMPTLSMSALGGEADIPDPRPDVCFWSMLSIKALRLAPNGDSVC